MGKLDKEEKEMKPLKGLCVVKQVAIVGPWT